MALRAGYKGFKKLLPGLKIIRPGTLGIDNDVLIPELNKTFFPRSEQEVLGAKNLFLLESSDISNNNSGTHTYFNGEITINCSNLQYSGSLIGQTKLRSKLSKYANIPCIVSFKYKADVACTAIVGQGASTSTLPTEWTEKEISVADPSSITAINFYNMDTSKNPVISVKEFMVRLATDTNPTYVPYAMTNRELTEGRFIRRIITSTDDLDDIKTTGIYEIQTAPANSPENAAYCTLIVEAFTSADIRQVVILSRASSASIYTRAYGGSPAIWQPWFKFTGTEVE